MKNKLLTSILLLTFLLLGACTNQRLVVYTVGDSTMAKKQDNKRPETGWAEMLSTYLDSKVTVLDHGLNGRSTKSFINEGVWDKVISSVKKGNYVIIQFGHNDEKVKDSTRYTDPKTTFRLNLKRFIAETRAKGGIPVLLTPITRRSFNAEGQLTDSHGEYLTAVREVATETSTLFIDANIITTQLVKSYGSERSKKLFLQLAPGEHPNYPNGAKDDTHLNAEGASNIARLIALEIKKLKTPLAKHVIN